MTCALKNSQPANKRGELCRKGPSKREGERGREDKGGRRGKSGWEWIDTHCLSHLGIQPTVIQVLSERN